MGTLKGKKISTAYARQLAKNYKERKLVPGDTQAVWFSTGEILEALGLSDVAIPIGHPVTGIRFYFGCYGETQEHTLEYDAYNKNTLMMVQTGTTEVGGTVQGKPVYQDHFNNVNEVAAYPSPVASAESESSEQNGEEEQVLGKIFNDGQTSPPPPKGAGVENDLLYPA